LLRRALRRIRPPGLRKDVSRRPRGAHPGARRVFASRLRRSTLGPDRAELQCPHAELLDGIRGRAKLPRDESSLRRARQPGPLHRAPSPLALFTGAAVDNLRAADYKSASALKSDDREPQKTVLAQYLRFVHVGFEFSV